MATREPGTTTTMHRMHTEVAVLQAHIGHIDEKVQQVRDDVKSLEAKMETNYAATNKLIKEIGDDNHTSHKELTDKISSLEKWKWTVMGGCMALGALGFEVVSKFF